MLIDTISITPDQIIAALISVITILVAWLTAVVKAGVSNNKENNLNQDKRMGVITDTMTKGFKDMTSELHTVQSTQAVHGEQIAHLQVRVGKLEDE